MDRMLFFQKEIQHNLNDKGSIALQESNGKKNKKLDG